MSDERTYTFQGLTESEYELMLRCINTHWMETHSDDVETVGALSDLQRKIYTQHRAQAN